MCGLWCFFFSSRRRHTRCALVTGVQTCALPIYGCRCAWQYRYRPSMPPGWSADAAEGEQFGGAMRRLVLARACRHQLAPIEHAATKGRLVERRAEHRLVHVLERAQRDRKSVV